MKDNGQEKNSNFIDYKCLKCNGTGFELYEENGYQYARECSCGLRQKQNTQSKLAFAELPKAYKKMKLDNFSCDVYKAENSKKIIETDLKVLNYWLSNYEEMKSKGMGLYFYSHTKGSGKTRLAVSLANELIETQNVTVKFTTSIQLIDEIKATWEKNADVSEHQLLQDLSKTEVLIIDDFGMEVAKPWIMERFYQVINSRYISNLITIFTSNMDIDSLDYDDRIRNRIKEKVYSLAFPEESIREQIYKNNMSELATIIG